MHHTKKTKNNTSSPPPRRMRLFLTGLSMGVADLVPGVSGGTIAFLYGIYDELLYSIRVFTGTVPRLILKADFKACFKAVPFGFLVPLMSGMLIAIFGFAKIFSYLLATYPVLMWSVFFGLVLGSTFIVRKRVTAWNARRLSLALAGFLATFILLGIPNASVTPTAFIIFLTGATASCAMILPGISGSLIMVMLGQYKNVMGFVSERNIGQLIIFAFGALVGLGLFSRLLSWLLRNYHSATIATLLGVMLGSLRRVWPWQTETADGIYVSHMPAVNLQLIFALILMAAGFMLVIILERRGIAREHNEDIRTKDFKKEIAAQQD